MNGYASEASKFLSSSGATAGVVSTKDVCRVKGGWDLELIVINFWTSPEEFEAAYTSGDCIKIIIITVTMTTFIVTFVIVIWHREGRVAKTCKPLLTSNLKRQFSCIWNEGYEQKHCTHSWLHL